MTPRRTLLGIFAHPDDEILGPGGTLARYAAEGVNVVLVVATRGEAGEIQRPGAATPETLPQVREEEMRCAAVALGVAEVIFLGYRDSGMAGTVENEDPRAFINAPADEVVHRLVAIFRQLRPEVVLTFEPYGGYGHPDHIAVNRHTVAAFDAAADSTRYLDAGPAWQARRLIYPIIPTFVFEKIRDRVGELGGDVSRFDELLEERRTSKDHWPDSKIHAELDVSDFVDAKWRAWKCHRTQFGPDSRFRRLPEDEMKAILSTEYFAVAEPEIAPAMKLKDLFAEVSLPEA